MQPQPQRQANGTADRLEYTLGRLAGFDKFVERLNKQMKRRADIVGIFPNEASIMRLIGGVLFKANDE